MIFWQNIREKIIFSFLHTIPLGDTKASESRLSQQNPNSHHISLTPFSGKGNNFAHKRVQGTHIQELPFGEEENKDARCSRRMVLRTSGVVSNCTFCSNFFPASHGMFYVVQRSVPNKKKKRERKKSARKMSKIESRSLPSQKPFDPKLL
ncbi:hypothetical protein CDAR_177091 [Caerostris darwini]|uniref:Uncharacterized protein n=1 Tax=Caerostris darwini TaxID=1538125 RepID=A0AAV4UBG4_9ARAC|nr:hypothetical protein CDAR_177091 [Caerostris darwini]